MTSLALSSGSRNVRLLAAGTVVNALGSGLYLPLSLVLLSRLSGLSLATVGLVLTGAMATALVLMPLGGKLVDRWGAKRVLMAALGAQGVAFALYPAAASLPVFVACAVAACVGGQAVKAAQPVLIASLATGPARARLLAITRSLANAGLGLGGLVLACVPAGAGRGWWVAAAWVNSASFLATIALYRRLQANDAATARPSGPRSPIGGTVWRDRRFLRLLVANVSSSLNYAALSNLVPLLAIVALHLPPALAGGLFTLNTVVTAAAGVPAVRLLQRFGISDGRAAVGGALAMAAGMATFAAAAHVTPPTWRAVALVAGMIAYSLGEAVHSPTSTSVALAASPLTERGAYQGVYQMSWGVGAAVAPAAFTGLLHWGATPAVALPVAGSLLCALLLRGAHRGPNGGRTPAMPTALPATVAAACPVRVAVSGAPKAA